MQPSLRPAPDQAPRLSLLELAKLGYDLRAAYDQVLREAAPDDQRQLLRALADRLQEPGAAEALRSASNNGGPSTANIRGNPEADTLVFAAAPLGIDAAERACLMEALGAAREKLGGCASKMPAGSVARAGAETLMANIDDLALLLTGDRDFFQ